MATFTHVAFVPVNSQFTVTLSNVRVSLITTHIYMCTYISSCQIQHVLCQFLLFVAVISVFIATWSNFVVTLTLTESTHKVLKYIHSSSMWVSVKFSLLCGHFYSFWSVCYQHSGFVVINTVVYCSLIQLHGIHIWGFKYSQGELVKNSVSTVQVFSSTSEFLLPVSNFKVFLALIESICRYSRYIYSGRKPVHTKYSILHTAVFLSWLHCRTLCMLLYVWHQITGLLWVYHALLSVLQFSKCPRYPVLTLWWI